MTLFSASDAALEGFHLVRRRWRVVLGWAGFNLLALIMIIVLSAVLSVVATAVGGGDAAKNPTLAAAALIVAITTLFAQAIIAAGVLRLEMRPQEPAFLHLRLGRDELRLVTIWLVTLTGAWVVGWMAALAEHALGVGGVWLELLALGLVIYLGLRFSLTPPVTFAEQRIDFGRSWRLTRGRAWGLLGMAALSSCLIGLVFVTVFVVLAVIAVLTGGLGALGGLFGGREAFQDHQGVFLLASAVEIILTPVFWMLGMAPLVEAYRAFAEPAAPVAESALGTA